MQAPACRSTRKDRGENIRVTGAFKKKHNIRFVLPSHLSLPGGSQIFQQRPAHHRACRLGKRQPHFLFQLPDSIGQAGLRNIELLHCMADGAGAGNSRDIAELLKGHGSFLSARFFIPPQSRQKRNVFSSLKYQTNIAGISKIRFTRPAISLIIAPQS